MRLEGIGKRYGFRQPWVVRDVNLDIRPGGLLRLEGRNGTGKSTLMRVIAGVSVPTKGKVTGRPVTGYVPERFPPALQFTARDYLAHIGRMHGLAGDALAARIDDCLGRLGGTEYAGVPLRHMSKGMCQKIAVTQALLPPAGLLVLDEAWTGLDTDARATLDDAVAQRLAAGGSVVYVDHDPRRLAHLDAQRWRIEHGEATQVGADHVPGGQAGPVTEIEVTGFPKHLADRLPGMISVRWDGTTAFIRVAADAADAALRRLLAAGDQVHVRQVTEREPGRSER